MSVKRPSGRVVSRSALKFLNWMDSIMGLLPFTTILPRVGVDFQHSVGCKDFPGLDGVPVAYCPLRRASMSYAAFFLPRDDSSP